MQPMTPITPADPEAELRAVQGRYGRQFSAIRDNLLNSRRSDLVESGRARVLDMTDPLAILPMSRELSRGSHAARRVLLEALQRFSQDEATLNIAVLALVEADAELRDLALAELRRRDDPRVVSQFRTALRSDADGIVARAAYGLGELRARSAVSDLIDVLTAERTKLVEITVPAYFQQFACAFRPQVVLSGTHLGAAGLATPAIGVADDGAGFATLTTRFAWRNVTVMRSEVLEALKKLTGENFGFDVQRWTQWFQDERQPAEGD